MVSLSGKCIWLTGASSGIGEALAYELAGRKAKVAITARREEILNSLVTQIQARGGTALAVPGDVQDLGRMKEANAQISSTFGPIDILLANAGSHVPTHPERFDSAEYMSIMQLNFGGMLHCIEAVLPSMLERKSGRIAPVASLAGIRGLPKAAAYGASKAAMINFLESIRFHIRRNGVSVTIIKPGFVTTPLTDKNDFYMPFKIDAPKAARIIADGLERERDDISFPFPFHWIVKGGRILPYPIYQWLVDKMW